MYQYSRAIFLAVKDLVDPYPDTVSPQEARRHVLALCEDTIDRLSTDPRYFARPTKTLFEQVRRYFPITQQRRVFYAIDRGITLALEAIELELQRQSEGVNRCRATT